MSLVKDPRRVGRLKDISAEVREDTEDKGTRGASSPRPYDRGKKKEEIESFPVIVKLKDFLFVCFAISKNEACKENNISDTKSSCRI